MDLEGKRRIMFFRKPNHRPSGWFFDNQKIYENTKEAFQIAIQKGLAIN